MTHATVKCYNKAILIRNSCRTDQSQTNLALNRQAIASNAVALNKSRSFIVITVLSLVLFVNSVSSGILTVGIPRMATDLELSEDLVLW